MVTEIMGGTHICRPSDPSEGEQKTEKNTILIMNNIPEVSFCVVFEIFPSTRLSVMLLLLRLTLSDQNISTDREVCAW